MKKLIVANWKMNPDAPGRGVALAKKIEREIARIRSVEVVVAPPAPFLLQIGAVLKKAKLGAQDSFWGDVGPYTGETSWHQLRHCGVEYAIIGHSERRIHLGETDEMVNKKIRAVLENGFSAILCIGERERIGPDIPPIVGDQIKAALEGVKKEFLKRLVIAYEPVWAISTAPGNNGPDTPDSAFRARLYIEKIIAGLHGRKAASAARIIYGGSVRARNVGAFFKEGKMDGALVGGASLDAKEFAQIVRRASA